MLLRSVRTHLNHALTLHGRSLMPRLLDVGSTANEQFLRPMRTLAFAVAAPALALAGHTSASGYPPQPLLAVSITAVGVGSAMAAGRLRRSIGWTFAYLVAIQVLAHCVLWATTHHGIRDSLIPGPTMVVAHAIATLAAAVLMVRTERLLQAWQCLVSWVLRLFPRPGIADTHVASAVISGASALPPCLELLSAIARRGPPTSLAVTHIG